MENLENEDKDATDVKNKEHEQVLVDLKAKMKEKDAKLEAWVLKTKRVVDDYVNLNTLKMIMSIGKKE